MKLKFQTGGKFYLFLWFFLLFIPIMLPMAPDTTPTINIIIPFELIAGVLNTILPIMYKINIYKNPVIQPVSQPFSLLFLPFIILAVKMLNNVIIILAVVIIEYVTVVYVMRKAKIKNKIIESI